jgi:hypothetical protein
MATIPQLLIKFISEKPLNISEMERILEIPRDTLRKSLEGRDIPHKHFYKVLKLCIELGFKINSKTELYLDTNTKTLLLITNLKTCEIFEVNSKTGKAYKIPPDDGDYKSKIKNAPVHFLYKQHQYRMILDETDILNHEFNT